MVLRKIALYKKMLVTPRLNMKCDDVKLRLGYVSSDEGNGWLIENFENDGKTEFFKGKSTKEIVEMIFDKYEVVNVTWSKAW